MFHYCKGCSVVGAISVFWLICFVVTAVAQPPSPTVEESRVKAEGNRWQPQQLGGWRSGRDRAQPEVATLVGDTTAGKFAIPADIDANLLDRYRVLSKLPPIESFFFGIPETVCFPDERSQVHDTTQMPWSANCQLIITMNGGRQAIGTGWLLGPRLVVTAGHCVHEGAGGNDFVNVEVIPGMHGPVRPFGSQIGTKLRASSQWKSSGTIALDYGAIILDGPFQSATGAAPGHHSIEVRTDAQLAGINLYLSGYPADKAFGSQWTDTDPLDAVLPERLKYMIDTYGGHSGSAVIPAGGTAAVGIHNYGGCPNYCTRITGAVQADLEQWLNESNSP